MIKALRGMKDLIQPEESEKFSFILTTASEIAKRYGFHYIETPKLEETALFKRSVGESSDIVGKEMYQFNDKGGNDVCLRPEGTAGVVRSFVEKKMDRQEGINRFFYHGSMFRYERPQKGRLREFHQFGCEVFGEGSVYEDANLIVMLSKIFDALGIGYTIELNSLGCPSCIPAYRQKLIDFLTTHKEHLCEDCHRRMETNPIRTLDCKNPQCQSHYTDAPLITDHLCEECHGDFETLKALLSDAGLCITVNKKLVRGLDYYSKTAFEFTSNEIGAQSAIAGGGRYDRLVEFLEGRPTPAVGFAIGIERIFDLVTLPPKEAEGYYLGCMSDAAAKALFPVAASLRNHSKVIFDYNRKSFKAHLRNADKMGMRYCVLVGDNELRDGTVWIKDLIAQEEKTLRIEEL